jgi:hypothetical protein
MGPAVGLPLAISEGTGLRKARMELDRKFLNRVMQNAA